MDRDAVFPYKFQLLKFTVWRWLSNSPDSQPRFGGGKNALGFWFAQTRATCRSLIESGGGAEEYLGTYKLLCMEWRRYQEVFLACDTQMYLGTYIQLYDNQEYLLIT